MEVKASEINEYWTDIYYHLHYTHTEKVTHQMIRILQHVEKGKDPGVGDIAEWMGLSPNTASEHVKRLIEKKYIEKKKHPEDERRTLLSLTKKGKEVLHRNTMLDEAKLSMILSNLNKKERDMVLTAFELLSKEAKQCTSFSK
ncbi:MarR family winged helix-turn-helix transcriptional regulator [Falsibacillus pallidus]|uniref:DNA-binding MarR family transcriptional regulator n=1 Tax=Falsibacillus pallidus TaxID=493781 RepID=A0A370GPA3_9BACI|nr:MarR family winged helix-turn-helix transcriptional regulator [Falsibacillus pallidus]RDI45507.1 DNA-binding MarR family transcriptional regulator [Falsibacillus pallidus]